MSYRASGSKGSKPKGQSAAAKHAYHLRADGYALGLDGPREDLAASGYGHMPAFAAGDPAGFWLASDSFERANGTLFRELQLNLPGELSLAQQQEVLQSYCARLFDGERLPHSWAIHSPDRDNHNPHAHLMVSETMTDDFSRPAAQHFKRYNSAKPEAGGAKKTRSLKPKAWLMEARAAWAEEVNRGLVAAGHKPRFDHRSKEVQLAEALRLGQLRRAARLDTPTQTHEGPRIAGMRRRVEAKKVALDDLPGYAQEVIKSNDQARELARAWLAQVERMTDAELAEHFADELNHGAHVKAWLLHEHAQALEEDRARSVATAQQAGELELLTAAQIEAAERAAIAAELGELIALEQGDHLGALLSIEREQAHSAALVEQAERAALAAELGELIALEQGDQLDDLLAIEVEQAHSAALIEDQQREAAPMQAVEQARARIEQLRASVGAPEPAVIAEVLAAKKAAEKLDADAQAWRAAHPVRAWFAVKETAAERAAREARAAYMASPKLAEAKAALADRTRDRAELAALEKQLPELERAAGIEPQADKDERSRAALAAAASDLRKAGGWMQNHASRCPYELREALHSFMRQIELELRQIEQLMQSPPAPAEAAQMRESAAERLGQAKGWREAQDAAQAAAQAAQLREREQLRHQARDAPEPRPRGPRGPGL